MSAAGNSKRWVDKKFPVRLIPQILDLVLSSWETMSKPRADAGEVAITEALLDALWDNRDYRDLPIKIYVEIPTAPMEGSSDRGRIDLYFNPYCMHERVYFCFECKRMNVRAGDRINSQATEYVAEGVIRFITGKYAGRLEDGGMIAYVMDGNTGTAIAAVARRIAKTPALCLSDDLGLRPSSLRPSAANIRETDHALCQRRLRLHHVFLSLS